MYGTGTSSESGDTSKEVEVQLPRLSEQIDLEELWNMLGECLTELDKTPDQHAVLILQPAVEAFFLVHAGKVLNILFLMGTKFYSGSVLQCHKFS